MPGIQSVCFGSGKPSKDLQCEFASLKVTPAAVKEASLEAVLKEWLADSGSIKKLTVRALGAGSAWLKARLLPSLL